MLTCSWCQSNRNHPLRGGDVASISLQDMEGTCLNRYFHFLYQVYYVKGAIISRPGIENGNTCSDKFQQLRLDYRKAK